MQYRTTSGVLEIDEDSIRILTLAENDEVSDNEIVGWTDDEWKDDPLLTAQIANAVALFFTEGAAAVAERCGKDFDSDGDVTIRRRSGSQP